MTKALFIKSEFDLRNLNTLLSNGWEVIHSCPMPSSIGGQFYSLREPQCLVIVKEKENFNKKTGDT